MGYFSDLDAHAQEYGLGAARDKLIRDGQQRGWSREHAEAFAETQVPLRDVLAQEDEQPCWEAWR